MRAARRLLVLLAALCAAALCGLLLSGLILASPARAEIELGDRQTFWATDWSTIKVIQIPADVRYIGEHVVIYVQEDAAFPAEDLALAGNAFDENVYPLLTQLLGSEPNPGVDGDERIVILLYRFRDQTVRGWFNPTDIDPRSSPISNRRDMFYMNLESLLMDPEEAGATEAHEFAHLIMYYRDFMRDSSPGNHHEEAQWVQEGIATYAQLAAGYPESLSAQLYSFEQNPGKNLTLWPTPANNCDYGASFAFVTYLAERAGPGSIADLVNEPKDGIAGINAVLKQRGIFEPFSSIFDNWVLANFLDGHLSLAPYLAYDSIDIAVVPEMLPSPLPRVGDLHIENYAAAYLDLPMTGITSTVRVVLDGEDEAPLHAALVSWDSREETPADVRWGTFDSKTKGATITSPPGYDRHLLVVWAQGVEYASQSYRCRYSVAVDPAGDIQFLDVGSDHRFFNEIDTLLRRGIIGGKELPPGSGLWYFRPDDNVLRQQFAKMAVETARFHTEPVENVDNPTFPDVPPFDSYGKPITYPFDYVEEAAALGVITGYKNGRFGPGDPITRIQLVRMILRTAEAAGKKYPPYSGSERIFADVTPGSADYVACMTAYRAGITSGSPGADGKLRFLPWDKASRGHVAKMTAGLLQHLAWPEAPVP